MKQKIGLVVAVLTAALGIVSALSPDRVDNLRLDFGLFIVRQLKYEIILVLIVGAIWSIPWSLKARLIQMAWERRPRFSAFSERQKILSLFLAITTATIGGLIILVILFTAALATRARIHFYKDLMYQSYRQELIQKGMQQERGGRPDEALTRYRQIIQLFPNDPRNNYFIQTRLDRMEGKLKYARECFARSIESEKNWRFNRETFFLLVEALRLDPTDDFIRNEMRQRIEKIDGGKKVVTEFYKAYVNRDQDTASRLLDQWSWYLFEDYFTLKLRSTLRSPRFDFERDLGFMKGLPIEDFERAVLSSWELEDARKVLEQSDRLLGMN